MCLDSVLIWLEIGNCFYCCDVTFHGMAPLESCGDMKQGSSKNPFGPCYMICQFKKNKENNNI